MANRKRDELEERFEAEGKTRYVTTQMVNDEILTADYHRFPDTTVTVCCIQLHNGFTSVGKSACANPDNFDPILGRELAYDDAKQQIFTLLAFRLCDAPQA